MDGVKSSLDVDALRSRTVSMPYPHFKIADLNKCVPIVVSALEEGDIPLLGTLNGNTKIVKRISNSAININKLLRVTALDFCRKEGDCVRISSILDYMEVSDYWT